jgi:CDP-diacylglycerol--serine O-phosphatidyltransferase
MLISAMPMILGALRLARFNVQLIGYDKDYFKGLPIPAMAITLTSYVLTYYDYSAGFSGLEASLLAPTVVMLSLLMVSTFKYDTVPKFSRRGIKQHPLRFTIGVIGITAIAISRGHALFPFFVFFVATGPLRFFVQFILHTVRHSEKSVEEKETEITSIDV